MLSIQNSRYGFVVHLHGEQRRAGERRLRVRIAREDLRAGRCDLVGGQGGVPVGVGDVVRSRSTGTDDPAVVLEAQLSGSRMPSARSFAKNSVGPEERPAGRGDEVEPALRHDVLAGERLGRRRCGLDGRGRSHGRHGCRPWPARRVRRWVVVRRSRVGVARGEQTQGDAGRRRWRCAAACDEHRWSPDARVAASGDVRLAWCAKPTGSRALAVDEVPRSQIR